MKTQLYICAAIALALSGTSAFAQIPPLVPTDVTGVGPGSPGAPMLQMQLNELRAREFAPRTIQTQARVIPREAPQATTSLFQCNGKLYQIATGSVFQCNGKFYQIAK